MVVCCWLFVVGCWLFVVGCLLLVVCCLLFVVCCLLLLQMRDFCNLFPFQDAQAGWHVHLACAERSGEVCGVHCQVN